MLEGHIFSLFEITCSEVLPFLKNISCLIIDIRIPFIAEEGITPNLKKQTDSSRQRWRTFLELLAYFKCSRAIPSIPAAQPDISNEICDVTGQNQALVAICHLPQIQF